MTEPTPDTADDALPRFATMATITAIVWAFFGAFHAAMGRPRLLPYHMAVVTTVLALLWWGRRNPSRARLATQLILGACAVTLLAVASLTGQSESVAWWYFGGIPLYAAYQLGRRSAVVWAAAAAVLTAAVLVVEQLVTIDPGYMASAIERTLAATNLVIMIAAFAVAHRTDVERHLEAARAARDAALEAAEAQRRFVANISHELRTPLNGVIAIADVMDGGAMTDDQRHHLHTIRKSGAAVLGIIDQVLLYARVDADALELERRPIHLYGCLQDSVDILARSAQARGLELLLDVDPAVPRAVLGDHLRLQEILMNLIGNALKFTHQGSIRVRARFDSAGGNLAIAVEDSGPGIPADDLSRIFASFTQGDASTTRRFGGTGLGLAISSRLANAMGGSLVVESVIDEGATFTLTLPVEVVPESAVAAPQASPTFDSELAQRHPLNILIAEDSAVGREVIRAILRRLGYEPTIVNDGAQAIDRASAEDFELVLLDLHMPRVDGVQAAREIAAQSVSAHRTPRLVGLTASVTVIERESCLAAGMDVVLAKPVDVNALTDVLRETWPLKR